MAELFELSAGLRLDLTSFEQGVARAMALAETLQVRLAALQSTSLAVPGLAPNAAGTARVAAITQGEAVAGNGSGVTAEALAGAVAGAMRGVSVQLDGRTVGSLVAATVDNEIGRRARRGRYTG